MSRLIDADALFERMQEFVDEDWNRRLGGIFTDAVDTGIDFAENAETIEAVPVVHGEWKFIDLSRNYLEPPYGDTCECSVCGLVIDVSETNYNFCPNCGAVMRKGSTE